MFRLTPPAGIALEGREMFRALQAAVWRNGTAEQSAATLAAALGVRHAYGIGSGRAGLWLILKALSRLRPGRRTVAIPAYTCFSVPAAIVRAGLRVLPVEVDAQTLDFDARALEAISADDLLAVVSGNLFGLVNNLPRLVTVAHARGAFLVDDAAQAMGARLGGRGAGTFGDAGLYSLGRGKALPAVQGGIVVTNQPTIARAFEAEMAELPAPSAAHSAALLLKMLAGSWLLHPRLYWIPDALPFLKLGVTEYKPDFPVAGLARPCGALVAPLLGRLEQVNRIRRRNAATLAAGLAGGDFRVPQPLDSTEPVYIRFPVIAPTPERRQAALGRLRRAGISASGYYPSAVGQIPGLEPHLAPAAARCPVAESLATRMITLPTHPLVGAEDLERMLAVFKEC